MTDNLLEAKTAIRNFAVLEVKEEKNYIYVGITNDWSRRLGEHNVIVNGGDTTQYRIVECQSATVAREVEADLHDEGFQGGGEHGGKGQSDSRFLYAYVITPDTVQ